MRLKQAGAYTVTQDEDSCVVFGMPKKAIKLGAVDKILSLDTIGGMDHIPLPGKPDLKHSTLKQPGDVVLF